MLIDKNAEINVIDIDGNTPLCSAASSLAVASMNILIKYGAHVNHRNN